MPVPRNKSTETVVEPFPPTAEYMEEVEPEIEEDVGPTDSTDE